MLSCICINYLNNRRVTLFFNFLIEKDFLDTCSGRSYMLPANQKAPHQHLAFTHHRPHNKGVYTLSSKHTSQPMRVCILSLYSIEFICWVEQSLNWDHCSFVTLMPSQERSEKLKYSNPDLCEAELCQLSYQAIWELVITWVDYKPIDNWYRCIYIYLVKSN